jgi:zinc D-Ala-D-Ala carboxypeptidase
MNLSEHFTLQEMTRSFEAERRGIANDVPEALIPNLIRVAATMEKVRMLLSYQPVFVHSGYRSPEVNKLVGGVGTSAHCKALACDFTIPDRSNYYVARQVADSGLPFDQLILEYGWVHLGLCAESATPRQMLLTKRSASSIYEPGINP